MIASEIVFLLGFLSLLTTATSQAPKGLTTEELWDEDWPFAGIQTFAHLPHTKCLVDSSFQFDIGIIGIPFDTTVSFRPGARFGPGAIRRASMRQTSLRGYNFRNGINPYTNWAKVVDCGDMSVTPLDNSMALRQMTVGYEMLVNHTVETDGTSCDSLEHEDDDLKTSDNSTRTKTYPRLISLGGDHSIVLPSLRALHKKYGRITLIHFDAHLDTWNPTKYPSSQWYKDEPQNHNHHFTHGSMLWMASEEGLLHPYNNFHVGLRTRLSGYEDYINDDTQGFHRIHADDIMHYGVEMITRRIMETIPADSPVYVSVDIDVIDPSMAPGTGTPEIGGFLSRELIQLLRNLEDLKLVGADIVEVNPSFDHADITALAAAQIAYELVGSMVKVGPLRVIDEGKVESVNEVGVEIQQNFKGKHENLIKERWF